MICDNSDKIEDIQVYAMVLPDHEINPRVPCNSNLLPRIDLTRFQGEKKELKEWIVSGSPWNRWLVTSCDTESSKAWETWQQMADQ